MGADQLIGRGDMLFLPPGSSDLVRCQGAFVSDDEINAIIDFMKRTGPPEFDEQFKLTVELGEVPELEEGSLAREEDELLPNAIEVLRTTKRASTSMLQRRLRIGYNRAARIMDLLEDEGIVGPENGVQPREILKDIDHF
jgi:S-DNA-T family DNA segregation ATPase FtsK/SpoIIIE